MTELATPVRVWDLPTRLFHWALAACVVGSVASAWIGGNAMVWHFRFGYAVFALLAFRLVWGLVGGHWSRFATFVYGPSALWRYLCRRSEPREHHDVGHSPLGALSVFALLAVLAAQVASGLFADDEIASTGPLVRYVTGPVSAKLTHWHADFGQWLIVALVSLHVGAIVYYVAVRRRHVLRPMLTGDKPLAVDAPASRDDARARLRAALLFALCAALVAWIVVGLGA